MQWVVAHAAELDVDTRRIAVGGASAGGALAAAVALMARDRGGPTVATQVLEIPVIDSGCNTPSMRAFASGYVFERESARDMWALYLATPSDAYHPYASPAHADDLGGLPPALVAVGEYDPLRDEGLAYAARLAAAGVATTAQTFPMCHGAALPETSAAVDAAIVAHLLAVFSAGG